MPWGPSLFMQLQPVFEFWDCTRPIVPPRSRLYALEPIGIGTPLVESLSGYVARLADAHAVSVGNLVLRGLSPLVSFPLIQSSGPNPFPARFYALNGLGESASKWIEALQIGTMQTDLRFLTLLAFADLFWPLGLFRRRRAWCRVCYADDRASGKPVYERLIWALRSVEVCPHHRQALEEVCPNCSRRSKPITAFSRPGCCFTCQEWLGSHDLVGESHITDEEVWSAGGVGALLSAAPRLASLSMRGTFTRNFQACVDYIAEGNKSAFADTAKIHEETVKGLLGQKCKPRISTLLRISYQLRIPLTSFLEPDLGLAADSLQQAKDQIQEARLPSKRSAENIRAVLERAASEQPPPRLSDVAGRLNYVKLDRLYRVDAKLCRRIASNYQKTLRGPGTRPSDKRFCSLPQMQRALEESLAQDCPTSPYQISLALGFVSDMTLRRKFPSLCQAIQRKIDNHNGLRIATMGRALNAALAEDPPPSLSQMCKRLGYCRPVVLRGHFPELCDRLLQRRRDHRVLEIEKLRQKLHGFSLESPAVSLEQSCKRVGFSRQQLLRLCPEECASVVRNFKRSSRETSRRKVEELHRQTRQIVTMLHEEGKRPSVKRVNALLGKAVLGNFRERAAAIRAVKAELGIRPTGFGHDPVLEGSRREAGNDAAFPLSTDGHLIALWRQVAR